MVNLAHVLAHVWRTYARGGQGTCASLPYREEAGWRTNPNRHPEGPATMAHVWRDTAERPPQRRHPLLRP